MVPPVLPCSLDSPLQQLQLPWNCKSNWSSCCEVMDCLFWIDFLPENRGAASDDLPGQCACFAFSRRHHWLTGRPGTLTTLYKDQAVRRRMWLQQSIEVCEGRNMYIYNGQRGKFNYNGNDHESRKVWESWQKHEGMAGDWKLKNIPPGGVAGVALTPSVRGATSSPWHGGRGALLVGGVRFNTVVVLIALRRACQKRPLS